ncbi:MAG: Spy/CpxP family protein refolding chaperone [Reyranellaceae bacterium]
MRAKLPWILLALSLVLNVFAIGGFIYGKRLAEHRMGSRSPIVAALHELDLDGPQKGALEKLREELRADSNDIRDEMRPLRRELLAEMTKATPDFAAADAKIDTLGDIQSKKYKAMLRSVNEFYQTLTPEQRQALQAGIAENLKRRDERRARRAEAGK